MKKVTLTIEAELPDDATVEVVEVTYNHSRGEFPNYASRVGEERRSGDGAGSRVRPRRPDDKPGIFQDAGPDAEQDDDEALLLGELHRYQGALQPDWLVGFAQRVEGRIRTLKAKNADLKQQLGHWREMNEGLSRIIQDTPVITPPNARSK